MNNDSLKSRRLIIPEVVQTSAMDCGPASLKSLFEGFGVSLSYGRLREACQTDVDGTSIDTVEDVAIQLGMQAQQTMVPLDHMLLPEARSLPAIVITSLPNGSNHFVVVWRRHGRFVQVMDPATGRRWPVYEKFLEEVYSHVLPVPAAAWRKWAASDEFTGPLGRRLTELGIASARAEHLIETALRDSGWHRISSLDAAARMTQSLIRSGAVSRGSEAVRVLETFFDRTLNQQSDKPSAIPAVYWSVRFAGRAEDGAEYLNLKGAVIVRISSAPEKKGRYSRQEVEPAAEPVSPEIAAALKEKTPNPGREIFRYLKEDGLFTPSALIVTLALVSGGLVFESLLFRGLLGLSQQFGLVSQQLQALAFLILFVFGLLLLELPLASGLQRVGRHLESRMRIAILEKLPRLSDIYFRSRLTSDMTERSHSIYALRLLPGVGGQMLKSVFGLILTATAIAWLDPPSAPLAFLIAFVSVLLPLATQPFVTDHDLRVRTHAGALTRFYLDALFGLIPVRAHGAERAIRREHESLLVEWARSAFGLQGRVVAVEAIQSLAGFALATLILFGYLQRSGEAASALLIIYWSLSLPLLGQTVAQTAQQYPVYRNITQRLIEPLAAPEEAHSSKTIKPATGADFVSEREESKAVDISFQNLGVKAGGHRILEEVNLDIKAGDHVAIIGPSGAGKSSLIGTLLGWHRASSGRVLIDGHLLDGDRLERLRRETAWIDPTVQIWNRSLLDNLQYGIHSPTDLPLSKALELSQLSDVLKKLSGGLQSQMGEAGALVSGGEGQRVRLGRGMLRPGVRLVLLDEPFRGLDRNRRRELLASSRLLWSEATLLCVTHDVSDTREFDLVVIIEQGRIVECGTPAALIEKPDSRYNAMIYMEEILQKELWGTSLWRRLRLESGRLLDN